MEVPRLGAESEQQLPAYATAKAMWDPTPTETYTTAPGLRLTERDQGQNLHPHGY